MVVFIKLGDYEIDGKPGFGLPKADAGVVGQLTLGEDLLPV